MTKTPRPDVEWLFNDLGDMSFAAVHDFTSATYDDRFIGVVVGFTERLKGAAMDEERFQMALTPEMARALAQALLEHAEQIPSQ